VFLSVTDPLGLFYSVFSAAVLALYPAWVDNLFSLLGLLLFAPHIFDLSAFILLYDTNTL